MMRASIVNGAWSIDSYDGDNQRIARWDANGTYITIQAGGRPSSSFNPVPGPLNWQRDSIYVGSQLVATLEPWGEGFDVKYVHQDAVGSVRAVTDAAGQTIDRYDYGAFGEGPGVTFSGEKQRFAGTERDFETLLDYMGARYYRSVTGRFNAVDPGHANGSLTRPQSWNAYAYASNNPLRFVDPTGMSDERLEPILSDAAPSMFDLDEFNAWADDYVWNNEYIQQTPPPPPPPQTEDPTTLPPKPAEHPIVDAIWTGAANFSAGAGDVWLLPIAVRKLAGTDGVVDKTSFGYFGGGVAGGIVQAPLIGFAAGPKSVINSSFVNRNQYVRLGFYRQTYRLALGSEGSSIHAHLVLSPRAVGEALRQFWFELARSFRR